MELPYWEWGGSNSAINRKTPEMAKFFVRFSHIKANGDCAEVQFDPVTLQALRKEWDLRTRNMFGVKGQ